MDVRENVEWEWGDGMKWELDFAVCFVKFIFSSFSANLEGFVKLKFIIILIRIETLEGDPTPTHEYETTRLISVAPYKDTSMYIAYINHIFPRIEEASKPQYKITFHKQNSIYEPPPHKTSSISRIYYYRYSSKNRNKTHEHNKNMPNCKYFA